MSVDMRAVESMDAFEENCGRLLPIMLMAVLALSSTSSAFFTSKMAVSSVILPPVVF